ncbi:hypothetical protein EVG20_g2343 [Dentipellis fragilis]|uniref:Uncharacterized protein n=1 Tax=Dentipellis fragilis TaxID=205917 RepID=A0A4Y9Z9H0_9AGAM|nr:hypothetical protein EVG20_g2343 [Dentipellis fragilis]
MSSLRQRIPFSSSADEDETEDTRILDEEEQDDLINGLRVQNEESNALYLRILRITLGLSCLLHLVFLASPTKDSPLTIFWPTHASQPLPLTAFFALLHVAVHFNLLLISWPNRPLILRNIKPLQYILMYPASAVAPVLCIFLGLGLPNFMWWSMTPTIILLHDTVHRWILQGEESIAELEKLKYTAKGA